MLADSPHLYQQRGEDAGFSADVVARSSRERSRQLDRGLTPVLTLGHLAFLTGASYGYLREIVERRRDPYVEITRPKRTGGVRKLASPDPALMATQRWVLRHALPTIDLHPATYAYREGRSIVDCAGQHLGAKWMVKMDLHDFFGSISEKRVTSVFTKVGYPPLVSFELARICTRVVGAHDVPRWRSARYTAIPSYSIVRDGHVPQGSPTSGAIANAVATKLDHSLSSAARDHGWTYTRYSDDLTFSAHRDQDRSTSVRLVNLVRDAIRAQGFEVHDRKTRIVTPGARHVVLGLLLDGDRIRLLPEFKRRVEVHIRGTDRFGLIEHADHRGFRSIFSLVNYVDGCLAFAQGVEPEWAATSRQKWAHAVEKSGMPPS